MTTITKKLFGKTAEGSTVYAYTLDGGMGVSATVLTYGGILQNLTVTDNNGCAKNVVLGYDCLCHYEKRGAYYGSLVGRVANRIGRSTFTLDGTEYVLPENDKSNQLHGGPEGFSRKIWSATENDDGSLSLRLESPDGDMGYPGNLSVCVTYSIKERALEIKYEAKTDAPTVVNLTNHAYFDITGAGSGRTMESLLFLDCDRISKTDLELIPTGEAESVTGTPYDFTTAKPVGLHINSDYENLRYFNGYDTNYYKRAYTGESAVIGSLTDPESGLTMTVVTDLPCVQLYTTNTVDDNPPDFAEGARHTVHCGICLETQFAPNAINSPEADSVILRPDQSF
ncbi:MAG: galactose mutarotase [Clostridia bacterium]|nr:galactose mutarotase [Clostridia bacterium]